MNPIEYIGFLAATLSCVSLLFEIIQGLKNRKLKDVAWGMLGLMSLSSLLWFIYATINHVLPLLISSVVHIVFQATLMGMKYRYDSKKNLQSIPLEPLAESVEIAE